MQVICKIDQPTPTSYTLVSPPITPTSSKDLMQIITKLLQQGQESAQFIRNFLNGGVGFKVEDHQVDIEHHCLVALNSFQEALSFAKSIDFDDEDVNIRKRKLTEEPCRETVSKERRGCYKRRRIGETWTKEVTQLIDDGYAWRKYGQKEILNRKFPRNYYRCTHKHDQHCQATKQVQQISENPTKYTIIYNGNHTCKYLNKTSPIILDDTDQNSSYLLNFETNNYPKVKNDPNFLPTSTLLSTTQLTMVKQEYTSIKEELIPISPSAPHDLDHLSGTHSNNQYSSSSENLPSSSDVTCNTPISDKGNSYDFPYEYDEDDIFNLIDLDDTQFQLDDILNK